VPALQKDSMLKGRIASASREKIAAWGLSKRNKKISSRLLGWAKS